MSLDIYNRGSGCGCAAPVQSHCAPQAQSPLLIPGDGVILENRYDGKGQPYCVAMIDPNHTPATTPAGPVQITAAVIEAMDAAAIAALVNIVGANPLDNKSWLSLGTAALSDATCAAEAEAFCEALPVKVTEV